MTACGTDVSRVHLSCPPLKVYSSHDQLEVLAETMKASSNDLWPHWIDDYGQLRAQCR